MLYLTCERIERTDNAPNGPIHGVQIHLRGANVFVTQQILHGANVGAAFQ